jgi:3-oxoacyl-[acyl-carrier protein] reductase
MTGDLMGAAPADGPDPLGPEYVAPLVTYLASPAAANINGEVFVVHGGVAAVMAAPTVAATFRAQEHGSPDGMWTLDAIADALSGFGTGPSGAGFLCEDTLALATETIGFGAGGAQ